MIDQMRRSSRSVCANLAEACETQVWLEFAVRCNYMNQETSKSLDNAYDQVIGQLVNMIKDSEKWLIR